MSTVKVIKRHEWREKWKVKVFTVFVIIAVIDAGLTVTWSILAVDAPDDKWHRAESLTTGAVFLLLSLFLLITGLRLRRMAPREWSRMFIFKPTTIAVVDIILFFVFLSRAVFNIVSGTGQFTIDVTQGGAVHALVVIAIYFFWELFPIVLLLLTVATGAIGKRGKKANGQQVPKMGVFSFLTGQDPRTPGRLPTPIDDGSINGGEEEKSLRQLTHGLLHREDSEDWIQGSPGPLRGAIGLGDDFLIPSLNQGGGIGMPLDAEEEGHSYYQPPQAPMGKQSQQQPNVQPPLKPQRRGNDQASLPPQHKRSSVGSYEVQLSPSVEEHRLWMPQQQHQAHHFQPGNAYDTATTGSVQSSTSAFTGEIKQLAERQDQFFNDPNRYNTPPRDFPKHMYRQGR